MAEAEARFAIYFAPAVDSPHWQLGTRWLGSDPIDGEASAQLQQPGSIAAAQDETQRSLTANARRYGLHATLKPPFRLHPGVSLAQLDSAVQSLARRQAPVAFRVSVDVLDGFLAWLPIGDARALEHIAMTCVSELDALRAPADAAELAKRRAAGLTLRQDALLQRWGYPYVMDEFRFHLTLSDRLPADRLGELREALRSTLHVASDGRIDQAMHLDALCIFMEPSPGADFRLIARHAFDGTTTRYPAWPR